MDKAGDGEGATGGRGEDGNVRAPLSFAKEVGIDVVFEDVVALAPPSRGAAVDEVDVETESLEEGCNSVGARVGAGEQKKDPPGEARRAEARP